MGGEGRSRVWLGYGVIFFFLKNPSLKNKIFFFFFWGGGGGGGGKGGLASVREFVLQRILN